MLYRLYMPGDFEALYAIEEVCFQPPDRFSRAYMRKILQDRRGATWIAEDDTRLCGFGVVKWTVDIAGVVAYVETLEVLPEGRGNGVGGELISRLEGSARAAKAAAIWLHVEAANSAAVRLYERHGYRLGRTEKDFYGRGRAGLVYTKLL